MLDRFVVISVVVLSFGTVHSQPGCGPDEYMCSDGLCIPQHWYCDGWKDCDWGGDDEMACPCDGNSYRCGNVNNTDGRCIPSWFVCDGWVDCWEEGDDEANCPCDFRCPDNTCISSDWVCDGWNDCYDTLFGADEEGCPCPDGEVKCPEWHLCIPQDRWCDDWWDCPQGGDELNCTTLTPTTRIKENNPESMSLKGQKVRLDFV